MSNFTRRHFLTLGAAGLAVVPRLAAAKAHSLTGVTYLPQSYKALSWGMNGFVERLRQAAKDTVRVEYYDSAQLLKADEQLPALRAGAIDFMFHTSSYVTRSLPILGIAGLPDLVEALYRNGERLRMGSPLFELVNAELAKHDLYLLSAGGGVTEPEYIWSTAKAPVRSLADLKGKRVRVVSFEATKALENFGAAAVRVPSSETYLALQRNTIDAAVANISTVIGRSLHEQTAYCYQLPTTAYAVGIFMLKSRWDNLAATVKAPLQTAAAWYDEHFAKYCNHNIYPNLYWPQVQQAGVELLRPSAPDRAAFRARSQAVWEHWKQTVGVQVGERAIQLALG